MRKILFWSTILSGGVAAYLMLKKGEPIGQVAKQVMAHPFGSLVDQVKPA